MKQIIILSFILVSLDLHSQDINDYSIRDLKGGRYTKDTSYVYWLPFLAGKKYLLIQGYDSKMSHKNELALDFKMKPGRTICAAREGVVIGMREDSDKGGLKDEYLSEGNYIMIRHADGSQANYWHLKKDGVLVNPGDSVKKGQAIGFSGNTGYTAFPHLHFELVPAPGTQYKDFWQYPARFLTKKGVHYLRPGKFYKSIHRAQ